MAPLKFKPLSVILFQGDWSRKMRAQWTQPRVGDLVLVRDFERDKLHGRKLDARWVGPSILTEIPSSGVSGYVQELYGEGVKKYHLGDLSKPIAAEQVTFQVKDRSPFTPFSDFSYSRLNCCLPFPLSPPTTYFTAAKLSFSLRFSFLFDNQGCNGRVDAPGDLRAVFRFCRR